MAVKKETTEVRREQIINAALTVIGEEGIQGLTTAKIARAVGISEANLYRHFKNKDAILTAVVGGLAGTISNNLKEIDKGPLDPLDKLEQVFLRHLTLIEGNKGIPRLVFSSELHFMKDLREELASLIASYLKGIARILKEGIKGGKIDGSVNTEAMAGVFIGMIQLTTLRWSLSDFTLPLLDEGKKLWKEYKKNIVK